MKTVSITVHIIADDHDMEQGSLQAFYTMPPADFLPKSLLVKNNRCLFLDVNGSGKGGPDFCLGNEQFLWLENELLKAKQNGEKI